MTSRNAVRRSVLKSELPDFTPVPRKSPRHDGWTVERQKAFIEALADTGCVQIACRMVNMTTVGAYYLRRQPGATSFRAAWEAAQGLGLQVVKDEAFDRAMHGQLIPVFVAGKLMGFRRKKNDRLLMFILRHYGQDAQDRKTTVNYFSTRATAGAASAPRPFRGEGLGRGGGGQAAAAAADPPAIALAKAEASTTTVKTVISGSGNAPSPLAADNEAADLINAFEGVDLDAEAQAEIYRTLEACAERRRALESDPENDPERFFIGERETTGYLGELESGVEGDWVEYRPEGEHAWESLGEGGNAAEIDRVVAEIEDRRAKLTPDEIEAEKAGHEAEVRRMREEQQSRALPPPKDPDPDDPRLDWRNWSEEGYNPSAGDSHLLTVPIPSPEPPISPRPQSPAPAESKIAGNARDKPRKPYKKRTPKPPFTPPEPALAESKIAAGNAWEARKAEAVAEVAAERRERAAGEAERRKAKARRD